MLIRALEAVDLYYFYQTLFHMTIVSPWLKITFVSWFWDILHAMLNTQVMQAN